MFEFTIKSTKNVTEFSVKFEDGSVVQNTQEPEVPLDSKKPTSTEKTSKRLDSKLKKAQSTSSEALSWDELDTKETQSLIVQKPEIPEPKEINVAQELHNLDF